MTKTLTLVAYMALLTWIMLLVASLVRARGWRLDGMLVAFGNRDNLPEATPLAGRAERTARNTLENFVLFAALALTAHVAGAVNSQVELGAQLFFWARVLYIPIYLAGITYVRTAVWLVSIVGLGMIFAAIV
jgi:uncharacterized MAPEG superfamily protein